MHVYHAVILIIIIKKLNVICTGVMIVFNALSTIASAVSVEEVMTTLVVVLVISIVVVDVLDSFVSAVNSPVRCRIF